MNEITVAIKKKAEEKYPVEWFGVGLTDYSYHQYKESQEKDQRAYTCGGEDAIGFMLKFVEWANFNYRQYQLGKWRKPKETIRYTTEQLLIKFLEDNKL